jgi:hypothetical protein
MERKLLSQGRRRFKQDVRYDLDAVTQGFEDRRETVPCDTELFQRVFKAYSLAIEQDKGKAKRYEATAWWREQRTSYLKAAMQALSSRDSEALQRMYGNFFRDDCATGLLPVQRMKNGYFGGKVTDRHRNLYLIDALYRLDYWKTHTGSRHPFRAL